MARILIVEDDRSARAALGLALGRWGHHVTATATGEEGLRRVRAARPELAVLDVMLPGIDGIELCRLLRRADPLPVILLTARGDDHDVVRGLAAGADDYVVKPVEPGVLDARIRAVLRRAGPGRGERLAYGDLVIDRGAMKALRSGRDLRLTPTELRLLLELTREPGRAMSRRHLLAAVWEHTHPGDSRLVDACVQRIRAKIEDDPAEPLFIETVRGHGYLFRRQ